MPEISRFFGIVIRMFYESKGKHHRPHFHAYYQGYAAVVAIDTLEVIEGRIPRAQQRLVNRWARIHESELQDDWSLITIGEVPRRIGPLRTST